MTPLFHGGPLWRRSMEQGRFFSEVDMDGEIQIADALLIARNAIGVAELTPAQMILADVYGSDGVITLNDALVTMRISLGL